MLWLSAFFYLQESLQLLVMAEFIWLELNCFMQ